MIAAESSLIERDRSLSAMPVLLDGVRLNDWFAEHGSVAGPVEVTYVRYKPRTSITVGLSTPAGPALGYAVTEDAAPKLDKLIRYAPQGSVLAHDRALRVMVARPAADRDLPGVRRASTPETRVLAYKPQRRWVAAPPGEQTIVRCYRRPDAAAAQRRWPLTDVVRVPAVRHFDSRRGVVVLERLPGERLDRLHGVARQAWTATGRMLATWHRDAPSTRASAVVPDVDAVAGQLCCLLPDRSRQVGELADRLRHALVSIDVGWCHGDFAADQVLLDGSGSPALLDWDRSGNAPRALDLAGADAAAFGTASTDADRGQASQHWEDLLAGYTELRRLPAGLPLMRAWSHFVRAAEPFRTATQGWDERIRLRLNRIEELL